MTVNIGIKINYEKLIESKLLAVANSGGGKSYLVRKLMEELYGKVQIIMIDVEGEFYTLREKFDFILFGNDEGSDYSIDIRYAEKMATTILDLGVSTIIDLYELPKHQRPIFVQRFLDAALNAPKELWHPCVFVIDEAHTFAPEKGSSVSLQSVNDFLSKSRKRGFCPILSTQRLSKLSKDSASECNNMLMGRCVQDIDAKRAADLLGFTSKEDMFSLRKLHPGEFFGFGPAIGDDFEITKFKVGKVKTTHIKAGAGNSIPTPPPTNALKGILEKITEIPKEAEKEFKTMESLKREVTTLKSKLTITEKKLVNADIADPEEIKKLKLALSQKDNQIKQIFEAIPKLKFSVEKANNSAKDIIASFVSIYDQFSWIQNDIEDYKSIQASKKNLPKIHEVTKEYLNMINENIPRTIKAEAGQFMEVSNNEIPKLGRCAAAILRFISVRPEKAFSKAQIGAMTGYRYTGGGFNNSLSELRAVNLIISEGSNVKINPESIEIIMQLLGGKLPGKDEYSAQVWLEKLPKASKKIFEILLQNPNFEFTKEDLGHYTGYESSGGAFANALSKLTVIDLAIKNNGSYKLNPEMLEI